MLLLQRRLLLLQQKQGVCQQQRERSGRQQLLFTAACKQRGLVCVHSKSSPENSRRAPIAAAATTCAEVYTEVQQSLAAVYSCSKA